MPAPPDRPRTQPMAPTPPQAGSTRHAPQASWRARCRRVPGWGDPATTARASAVKAAAWPLALLALVCHGHLARAATDAPMPGGALPVAARTAAAAVPAAAPAAVPAAVPAASPPAALPAAVPAPPRSGLDLAGFDPQVRPQDDLFRHANGRWLAQTPLPADKSAYGKWVEVEDLADQRVRALVESLAAAPQPAGSTEQQIAAVYRAMLDTPALDRAGLRPLAPLLAAIDAIDTPAALARWLGEAQGLIDTPVTLVVEPDAQQPGVYLAQTWQGGLGLPDRRYYLQPDGRLAQARAAYRRHLARLARLAGMADPEATARAVLALETRIARAHRERQDNRDPRTLYHPMDPATLARRAPGFDWAAFLAGAGLGHIDRLSVSQPETATAVARLARQVPLATWRTYLRLRLLDTQGQRLPAAFRAAHADFHGRVLAGLGADKPRWQRAIDEVNATLGEALGRLYVDRHFPPAHRDRVQAMVAHLREAFAASIDDIAWMGPATRAAAHDKLARMALKIGYPDRWRRYDALVLRDDEALGNHLRAARFEWQRQAARAGQPVDRGEWGMLPQAVNAYYDPSLNEIVFPAGILQPPFFDAAADDAVNYGAIGAIIGHEISHGFDEGGSQFDGEGRLRNWWGDADRRAFEALGARLATQYGRYEVLPGRPLNGRLTLDENIADVSGLQVAWRAWQRALGGRASPVLDGYTGAQRFFLGWAQLWREQVRDAEALRLLAIDPHAPARFRTNGAAVDHDAFHEAFGTRPGDALHRPPAERIRIW